MIVRTVGRRVSALATKTARAPILAACASTQYIQALQLYSYNDTRHTSHGRGEMDMDVDMDLACMAALWALR